MKNLSPLAALVLSVSLAAPLAPMKAQEAAPGPDADAVPLPDDDGFDLIEEGAQLMMRGLLNEMAPALEELEDLAREIEPALEKFVAEMGPAMTRLLAAIDDIDNYEAPEILENGDIIIRRSPDAPPWEGPMGDDADGKIDI